jgi:hypothetical protein
MCQHPQQTDQLLKQAAASKSGADSAWVARAQELLGMNDAKQHQQDMQVSLASAQRVKDTSSFTGWWWYNIGTIQAALGHKDLAGEAFNNALLLPDSMMSHHLSRIAMASGNNER